MEHIISYYNFLIESYAFKDGFINSYEYSYEYSYDFTSDKTGKIYEVIFREYSKGKYEMSYHDKKFKGKYNKDINKEANDAISITKTVWNIIKEFCEKHNPDTILIQHVNAVKDSEENNKRSKLFNRYGIHLDGYKKNISSDNFTRIQKSVVNEKAGEIRYSKELEDKILSIYKTIKEPCEKIITTSIENFVNDNYLSKLGKYLCVTQRNLKYQEELSITSEEINKMKSKEFTIPNIDYPVYLNLEFDNSEALKGQFGTYRASNWEIPWNDVLIFLSLNKDSDKIRITIGHELIHAMQYFNTFFISVAQQVIKEENINRNKLHDIILKCYLNRGDQIFGKGKTILKNFPYKERDTYLNIASEYKTAIHNFLEEYFDIENDYLFIPIIKEAVEENIVSKFVSQGIKNILNDYSDAKIIASHRKEFYLDLSKALRNRVIELSKANKYQSLTNTLNNSIKKMYPINIEKLKKVPVIYNLLERYKYYFGKEYNLEKLLKANKIGQCSN